MIFFVSFPRLEIVTNRAIVRLLILGVRDVVRTRKVRNDVARFFSLCRAARMFALKSIVLAEKNWNRPGLGALTVCLIYFILFSRKE